MKESRGFRSKNTAILRDVVDCDQIAVDKSISGILAVARAALPFSWLVQIDDIASSLAALRDVCVAVRWRLWHAMRGRWLWWKMKSTGTLVRIWRHMFDYFLWTKRLYNLRWVFSPNHGAKAGDYYRGDGYANFTGLEAHSDRVDCKHFPGYERVARVSPPFGSTEYGPRGSVYPPGDFDYGRLCPPFAVIVPARIITFSRRPVEVRCASGAAETISGIA